MVNQIPTLPAAVPVSRLDRDHRRDEEQSRRQRRPKPAAPPDEPSEAAPEGEAPTVGTRLNVTA
ncbi:MAG: hypothetical protein ACLGHP_08255 [Vicinamibacteria bacterium]